MALLPQRQTGLLPRPRTQLLPLDMGASVRAEAEGHQQRFGAPQGAYIPFPTMPTKEQIGQWVRENSLDAAALATSPIPVVGDVVGFAADANALYNDPSWSNAGWMAAGLLPFLPAGTVKRVVGEAGDVAKSMRKMDELTGLPINPDGTVTLYHATPTKEAADAIRRTGVLKSAGEPDVYMSTAKSGTGYGDYVVEINVDPKKIEIDDEFPDGRKDFRMSVGKPGGSVTVGLPTDEASRMARAEEMGMTKDVYHGTYAEDFPEVDMDKVDLGLHVGTSEQANNRLKSLANPLTSGRSGALREGARIMPLKADIGKTLELKDIGMWNDSEKVAQELRRVGIAPEGLLEEIEDVKGSFEDYSDFLDSPENRALLDEMRNELIDRGYDSITYRNLVENEYGDSTKMLESAAALRRDAVSEYDYMEMKIRDRMPQLPDLGEPDVAAKIEAWRSASNKIEDYATPEELTRLEELKVKIKGIDDASASYEDPNSYIILKPEKVRSRHAKFDPAKKNSADLLAGIGAGGLLGIGAYNRLSAEEEY